LESNGVDDRGSGTYVKDFHDGIVDRIEGREQIQVSRHKHQQEKFMRP
jgi:hypothetical protein